MRGVNFLKNIINNLNTRNRNLLKLTLSIIVVAAIIVGYIVYNNYTVIGSVSAPKYLTANGTAVNTASIATNTYTNTTTTTANSNYYQLRESADLTNGLSWNFTGWTALNTATEATGPKVTKVRVVMDAAVGDNAWTTTGSKTFQFRMYNFSNGLYDLITTATALVNTRTTYTVVTLDFPSPQDYTNYFDASGNFRIQMENTADGDIFATYLRIEYLYVYIYYDKTNPNVSWNSPSGNPTPYYSNAASVTLQANGDDNTTPDTETTGVSGTNFYYNNGSEIPIGTDTVMDSGNAITGGVWSYAWSPADGSYSVYARVYDGKNNLSANSATQTIVVDRTAPTATITAPASSGRINGTNYAITGTATDALSFNYYKVDYSPAGANTWTQIGTNQSVAVNNGTLINWNTTAVPDGNYDLRLTVLDKATNTTTSTVTSVAVDNTAPALSLEYYSNAGLTLALPSSGGKPLVKAGAVYVKLVPNETLRSNAGDNQITIDAPGTANDLTNANFTWNGSAWVYLWTVVSGGDGDTLAINVKGTDLAGNVYTGVPTSGGTVTLDNTPPVLSLQYYYDANLTTPVPVIGGKPQIRTGTSYVKLVANETLSSTAGDQRLTIDAPGGVNDVNNQAFVWDAVYSAWKYTWTVSSGNDGDTLSISVTGKDLLGFVTTGAPTSGALVTIQTVSTPTVLTLTANPTLVVNDNIATSTLTAHLVDQYGTALNGLQINFSTDLGTLSAPNATTNVSGDAAVTIRSGANSTANITGTLNNTTITGSTTVKFSPPDIIPPSFGRVVGSGKQLIYLTFSEPIKDPNTSGATITIDGGLIISQKVLTSDPRIVKLILSNSMGTGNQATPLIYTVTVQNIKDLANNNLVSATQTFEAFTPHGKYTADTAMCSQCHATHTATGQKLNSSLTITKACFVCHGITGISVYKVEGEFTSRISGGSTVSYSLHKSLDSSGNNVLNCTDCHNPHGNKTGVGNAVYSKLLRSSISGTEYYQGNNFCFACHGSVTNPNFSAFYDSTGGNHNNANAVHYNTTIQSGLMLPASGTQITCMKCHEKHGSQYSPLIDNTLSNGEEQVCYKCHGDTLSNNLESAQTVKQNVYRQFNIAPAPAAPTLASQTTTTGLLAGGATYYFKVTAVSSTIRSSSDYLAPPATSVTPLLESLPSSELAVVVPAGTNTNKITLTIPQYTAATGYDKFNVYMNYRLNAPAFTVAAYDPGTSLYNANIRLTPGTYKVKITAFGPFGETFPTTTALNVTTTLATQGIRVTITNTGTQWPIAAGYPKANYFNIYANTTAGGTEKLIGTILQTTTLPSVKDFYDNITTIVSETVPSYSGANNQETQQTTITATGGGNTTYVQTAVPLTKYPVPKGSEHQIDPSADPTRTGSKIECSNCHGPHTIANVKYSANQATSAMSDPTNTGKYWVSTGVSDSTKTVGSMATYCLTCHSSAANITQTVSSTVRIPYTLGWPGLNFTNNSSGWFKDNVFSTSDHGNPAKGNYDCTACHDQHGSRNHLLLKAPYDGFDYEGNCLRCHNGTTTAKNIKAEFQKVSRHPTLDSGFGDHEINENYNGMGMVASGSNRHAKCEDCHDPHSVNNTPASPPTASGAIKNVTGVGFVSSALANRPVWTALLWNSTNYQFKRPITNEYELCYKCHSSYAFGTDYPTSTSGAMETDIAMQFNPNNPSYHPIEAVGKNPTIAAAAFVNGFTASSRVFCFDCHGDNVKLADGVTANPTIVRGPHGSLNKFLLKAPYDNGEISGSKKNDLCVLCHNTQDYATSGGTGTDSKFTQGSTNLHIDHIAQMSLAEWFCGDCHGLYVHGQQRAHLITLRTDPYPYGQWSILQRWTDPGGASYNQNNCYVKGNPGRAVPQGCESTHNVP